MIVKTEHLNETLYAPHLVVLTLRRECINCCEIITDEVIRVSNEFK